MVQAIAEKAEKMQASGGAVAACHRDGALPGKILSLGDRGRHVIDEVVGSLGVPPR